MIPNTISADTTAIADKLLSVPVGECISLAILSDALGRDITKARHLLYSAFRVVRRDNGFIFTTVRGIGYRRLSAKGVTDFVGTSARAHIRRTARKAKATIEDGIRHANDLPPDIQRKAMSEISSLALLEHIAKDAMVKPQNDSPMKPEPVAITARRFLARIGAYTTKT